MYGGAGGGEGGVIGGPKDPWEELVASNPEPRNWKGIIISILVILSVILMVACAVVWMTPPDPGPRVTGERIHLDLILDGLYRPTNFNATYVGSDIVYIDMYGGLSKYNFKEGSSSNIVDNSTFRTLNSHSYQISDDLSYMLVAHDIMRVFRHSSLAKYTIQYLRDRSSPLLRLGESTGDQTSDLLKEQELLQLAMFLPTRRDQAGSTAVGVIFVKDNDIFYRPKLPSTKTIRLTATGRSGTIYNGVADWLYEEEVLSDSVAIWPGPQGDSIAYAVFNDSKVEKVTIRDYGSRTGSRNQAFPARSMMADMAFRYPKAGGANPEVELYVQPLPEPDEVQAPASPVKVQPPEEIQKQEHYLTSVSWLTGSDLAVVWMNRQQNTSYYTICRHPEFLCQQVFVERTRELEGVGWIDNRGSPLFSSDTSQMVMIQPQLEGEGGYWPQVVMVRVSTTDLLPTLQLTHGQFEVTEILAWDQTNSLIYFIATLVDRPGERHFLYVEYRPGEETESRPKLLSMYQTDKTGRELRPCLYSRIHLSPNFDSYIQECLGPNIPETALFSLPENRLLWKIETNQAIKDQVRVSSMPRIEWESVKLPGFGKARVKLTLPPVLREEEEFIFPLIVNVYGGPGTQIVDTKWSVGWDTYLASKRDFIVATIDVTGSGFQGLKFKHKVHQQLGKQESADILHVIRHLIGSKKYIDSSKVCIWGWSFGGYLAAFTLIEDGKTSRKGAKKLLSCGISVAPVTQWQNYDSAYTERFLGLPTPDGNWKGYSEASLTNKVEYIEDNSLLVMHGTSDDNVHVQHTMQLARALVHNHIIYRQQIYPDENHGLFGVTKHQHQTMEAFLDDIFGPIEDFFQDDYYLAAANLLQQLEDNEESCFLC